MKQKKTNTRKGITEKGGFDVTITAERTYRAMYELH